MNMRIFPRPLLYDLMWVSRQPIPNTKTKITNNHGFSLPFGALFALFPSFVYKPFLYAISDDTAGPIIIDVIIAPPT
jgi:hypothetical protein